GLLGRDRARRRVRGARADPGRVEVGPRPRAHDGADRAVRRAAPSAAVVRATGVAAKSAGGTRRYGSLPLPSCLASWIVLAIPCRPNRPIPPTSLASSRPQRAAIAKPPT